MYTELEIGSAPELQRPSEREPEARDRAASRLIRVWRDTRTMSHDLKTPATARRDFLKLGSASMMFPLVGGSTLCAWAESNPPVQVGYWQGPLTSRQLLKPDSVRRGHGHGGDDDRSQATPGAVPRFVSADALRRGDPRFARGGARVTIHGLTEGRGADQPSSLNLDVHYRCGSGHDTEVVRSSVFSFSRHPVRNASAPVSVLVPVDARHGLAMSLSSECRSSEGLVSALLGSSDQSVSNRRTDEIRFAVDATPGAAKLRRGVYLIGVTESSAFSTNQLEDDSYLLMTVDYGDTSARPGYSIHP